MTYTFSVSKIEEPFDGDFYGRVYFDERGRKYIVFCNKEDRPIFRIPYARYVYQIWYWKENKKWIPYGYEVDHKNDDCTDDRLENLQLLTREENRRKRDYKRYKNLGVYDALIDNIKLFLDNGYSYKLTAKTCNISDGYLRYIIDNYLPNYSIEYKTEQNIDDIKNMLHINMSFVDIGYRLGVSQATVSRIIEKHLPEYSAEFIRKQKIETVKNMLSEGYTQFAIAEELKCDQSNISHLIKKHLKNFYEQMISPEKEKREGVINNIGKLLKEGKKQIEISRILNLPSGSVNQLVNKNFPEFVSHTKQVIDWKTIGPKLEVILSSGYTQAEASRQLNTPYHAIGRHVRKHLPQFSGCNRSDLINDGPTPINKERRDRIKQYLDDGIGIVKMSKLENVGHGNISQYVKKYFPEWTRKSRLEVLKNEIVETIKKYPDLSNNNVVQLLKSRGFKTSRDYISNIRKNTELNGGRLCA